MTNRQKMTRRMEAKEAEKRRKEFEQSERFRKQDESLAAMVEEVRKMSPEQLAILQKQFGRQVGSIDRRYVQTGLEP